MSKKNHVTTRKTDKVHDTFVCLYLKTNLKKAYRLDYVLLILSILFLPGCKTSRKASSSKSTDKISVTFDAGDKSVTSSNTSSSSSVPLLGYPANEYYGSRWNTEHVRINSDPKPSGTTTLNLTANFVMPVCGKVLSEFGPRNGRMHTGIDLKVEKEDPIYCAFDGMVRVAKDYGSYGKVVVVRHDNGLETLYSHLNSIAVKLNQRVQAGNRIGGGGKTGNAQGEHLHFEVRFKGEPFNPRLVVDFENCRLKSETLVLNNNSYKQYYRNLQVAETKPAETKPTPKEAPAKKTAVVQTAEKRIEHIVEKGDTLYNISRRYETTVDLLRQLNSLTESSIIEIGQVLIVK